MTLSKHIAHILAHDPASWDNPRRLDTVYLLQASGMRYLFSKEDLQRIVWAMSDPRLASPESVQRAARQIKRKPVNRLGTGKEKGKNHE